MCVFMVYQCLVDYLMHVHYNWDQELNHDGGGQGKSVQKQIFVLFEAKKNKLSKNSARTQFYLTRIILNS